jgi:hypothetical protein
MFTPRFFYGYVEKKPVYLYGFDCAFRQISGAGIAV